jgi:N-acetylglucosamine malate deacetylase 2
VEEPVAVVVAHPDDETIGAGASLPLFRRLLLVHATDGAPRNLADARAASFATAGEYAAARGRELEAALAAGGVRAERAALGAADQGASLGMAGMSRALAALLERHGARAVLTHPYEGGHPDHDALAFCARAAASLLARGDGGAGAPEIIEMAFYHAGPEDWAVGRFLPDGPAPTVVPLATEERARKRAMLDAFATQAATLARFPVGEEAFRPAPAYHFGAPPHAGALLYERFPWGMDGARWRRLAADAARALGLAA